MTTERIDSEVDTAKHPLPLTDRDAAAVRVMFAETMRKGGVSFIDRTAIIRSAALHAHSSDIRVAESEGLSNSADYLLQILPVKDDRAPTHFAFTVSLLKVQSLEEVATGYSLANPWVPDAARRYVATDRGFEIARAPPPHTRAEDIGIALAIDVMRMVGPRIASGAASN